MIEIECACGNKINEGSYPSGSAASALPEANEDAYADFIALEIESYVEAVKKGNEKEWFKKRAGKEYPDDVSPDTLVYDILGESQEKNMFKIYECEKCGKIYFVRKEKIICFEPSEGKYQKALGNE